MFSFEKLANEEKSYSSVCFVKYIRFDSWKISTNQSEMLNWFQFYSYITYWQFNWMYFYLYIHIVHIFTFCEESFYSLFSASYTLEIYFCFSYPHFSEFSLLCMTLMFLIVLINVCSSCENEPCSHELHAFSSISLSHYFSWFSFVLCFLRDPSLKDYVRSWICHNVTGKLCVLCNCAKCI